MLFALMLAAALSSPPVHTRTLEVLITRVQPNRCQIVVVGSPPDAHRVRRVRLLLPEPICRDFDLWEGDFAVVKYDPADRVVSEIRPARCWFDASEFTGCADGETLFMKVMRDPTNSSDTLAANAQPMQCGNAVFTVHKQCRGDTDEGR